MKKLFAVLISLVLAACASSPQLPYQYATLKLIEREAATAEQVIERAERVESLLSAEVELTVVELESRIKATVGYADLAASDRLLVDALLGDLSFDLGVDIDAVLSDEHKAAIRQRLGWIMQAARMAD